jgi:hypothetical protein
MMSQLSQPSWSISSRDIGKNGAGPKQAAQYCGQEKRSLSGWIRDIALIVLPKMVKK